MEKNRVEAFSDGVLAIAITLLIIEVRIPESEEGELWDEIVHAWPQLAAYVVSFFIIGIIWVNHHALLGLAKYVDRPLLFFNLLLLLFIVLIPFSTALLADYIRASDNSHVAAAMYSGNMLLCALAFRRCGAGSFRGAAFCTNRWILAPREQHRHALEPACSPTSPRLACPFGALQRPCSRTSSSPSITCLIS